MTEASSGAAAATKGGFVFRWTRIVSVNQGPCARSSHGVSLLTTTGGEQGSEPQQEQRLYVMGGENVARTPLDAAQSCWCLDLQTLEWRPVDSSNVPVRLAHAQASVANEHAVYVFGGRAGITMNERAMNDVWKLDCSGSPGQEVWSNVELGDGAVVPLPEPRSFHRMISMGGRLYAFGGCGATGRLADLHSFDPSTATFRSHGSSSLRGRGGPNLLPLAGGTKLAVVAGFAGEETADGQIFDLATQAWVPEGNDEEAPSSSSSSSSSSSLTSRLDGMRPRSVCVSASFPSAGIAIIFGGEVNPSDRGHEGAGGFAHDLVVLDESDGSLLFTVEAPPAEASQGEWPCPRGWAAADSVDHGDGTGSLYLFGGLTGDDTNPKRLDDLWSLDISKSPQ